MAENVAPPLEAAAVLRRSGSLSPAELKAAVAGSRVDGVADNIGLRADGFRSSPSADEAFAEFVSRDQVADAMRAGGVPEEFVEEATERALVSGRSGGLDRGVFTRVSEFLASDDRAPAAFARWGMDAVDNPRLLDAVCVANSFGSDTLVALADGSLAPIADIQVGDEVLAFDFDTGTAVSREVTATLPHSDWLLDAHFSDGTVMSVTEDHRFWSVTDDAWVELQDLDTDDQLLTPDGVTVTVDWLDWDAGVTAPAWDLTVDDVHNFFVTAEADGEPLLVHNQTTTMFCGVNVGAMRASALADLNDDLVQSGDAAAVSELLNSLTPSQRQDLLDSVISVAANSQLARKAVLNAATRPRIAAALSGRGQQFSVEVLTAAEFEDIASVDVVLRNLAAGRGASGFVDQAERSLAQILEARSRTVSQNPFEGALSSTSSVRKQADAIDELSFTRVEFKTLPIASRDTLRSELSDAIGKVDEVYVNLSGNTGIDQSGVATAVQDRIRRNPDVTHVEVVGVEGRYRVVWTAETGEVRTFEPADTTLWTPSSNDVLLSTLDAP